jgi:hypothetical protein
MTRCLSVIALVIVATIGWAREASAAIPGEQQINDYYDNLHWLEKAGLGPKFGMVQKADGSGAKQLFDHGALYWRASTGVIKLDGAFWTDYQQRGAEAGVLGMPVHDEGGHVPYAYVHDGYYWTSTQEFANGELVRAPHDTQIYAVYGSLYEVWQLNGSELGVLGLPIGEQVNHFSSGPTPLPIAWEQAFQGGDVSWSLKNQLVNGTPWLGTIDPQNTAKIRVRMPAKQNAIGKVCERTLDATVWVHDDADGVPFEAESAWCSHDPLNKTRSALKGKLRVPSSGVIQMTKPRWGFTSRHNGGGSSTLYNENPDEPAASLSAFPGNTDTLEIDDSFGDLNHGVVVDQITVQNLAISDDDIVFPAD